MLENLIMAAPSSWRPWFFRTAAGAEIDLVFEIPSSKPMALEIKRTLSPSITKGFHLGCEDIRAGERYYVLPEGERHPLDRKTEAISLMELVGLISSRF